MQTNDNHDSAWREARRAYNRHYRETHRDEINARRRAWAKANPEKITRQHLTYWMRRAKEMQELGNGGDEQ